LALCNRVEGQSRAVPSQAGAVRFMRLLAAEIHHDTLKPLDIQRR
jgi:hypothetical protein